MSFFQDLDETCSQTFSFVFQNLYLEISHFFAKINKAKKSKNDVNFTKNNFAKIKFRKTRSHVAAIIYFAKKLMNSLL